ncbi:bacteriohopanetetrol glucosamine biosynthesis glycosyltransferase HpnI [Paraburkholderia tagetis]|uniref:Bacteriohopanetetrol glucosamine biosynthesis glycosyltransferase HpnI n=1 Tax=Paraburkholderia tagetis TaxID=2913261 RepID=A0A9X1UEU7_9BURK|nr:bacteriohopanetetrol glucosamine biosynthesis glycosyltransferase HpnI [Paraburkholderia tagetis]MCG5073989.1 bacteriohopanetetrol glucosamine biosynthesis glycosyltransferase HpnI [Paraburkholderia tagetis]
MTAALVSLGPLAWWLVIALCGAVTFYAISAALAMPRLGSAARVRMEARRVRARAPLPVSVLKPLCGAEPRLYENLATFCEQHHPRYQLIFGVSSSKDPAIAVVQRLQAAYPGHDIALVIDSRVHGSNLKVSNLINMAAHARHDVLIVADSDIAVEPDYLEIVTAPLADPQVGVVTCLYSARSVGGFWPRVGALFINEWFAPSVRVAHSTGSRAFGFGATLALSRGTLERIGGFESLKDCLADDYQLARFARDHGLATVLAPVLVATDVIEPNFRTLWLRETRWLRTIRSVNPAGFASLFITFTSPWLVLGALACWQLQAGAVTPGSGTRIMLAALGTSTVGGIIARLALHVRGSSSLREFWHDLPLVPLRDALLLLQWLAAVFGSHVIWRGVRVPVANPDTVATVATVDMAAMPGTGGEARVSAVPRRAAVEVSDGR